MPAELYAGSARTRTGPRPSSRGPRSPCSRATGRWPRRTRPAPAGTSDAGRASAGRRGPTSRGGRHTSTPRVAPPGWPARSAAPSPRPTRRPWTGSSRSSPPRRTSPWGTSTRPACLLEQVTRSASTDPLSGRLHHHLVRAGVARAAGDVTAARRELKTGLTTLANQQARHHSLDLRTAMAVHGGRLAELDLRIALESGSARMVFDSLERWRRCRTAARRSGRRATRSWPTLLAGLRIITEEIRHSPPGRPVEHLRRRQRGFERSVREREWTVARRRSRRALRHARRHPAAARPAGHCGRRLLRAGPPARRRHRRRRPPARGHARLRGPRSPR